jgi:hypothetical protein
MFRICSSGPELFLQCIEPAADLHYGRETVPLSKGQAARSKGKAEPWNNRTFELPKSEPDPITDNSLSTFRLTDFFITLMPKFNQYEI